jgi:cytochrome P450/ferredoxin-NADP reductase
MVEAPHYDVDFYADAFIHDPYTHYKAMRSLGPIVYLPQHDNYAVVRFAELRECLRDTEAFRSGGGVAADDTGCAFLRGNTLASDPPIHTQMRSAMGAPLLPSALTAHRSRIVEAAEALVDELCERRSFCGVVDLAQRLPLTVVTELVGLPGDGAENMLRWAAASFDILGIQNERGQAGTETIKEMRRWIANRATVERLRPGSWTARILELAEAGEIPASMAPQLVRDYINPSLDTTIAATAELILQLAQNPDQWDLVRNDPSLIPQAVDEAVRLATPIRSFTRTLSLDRELWGVRVPHGARVMMVFASANRDERRFVDPERFLVRRTERDHVGFGHGIHMCVGMHLARLEMTSLLAAMVPRIASFNIDAPIVAINNTIRGYSAMPTRIEIAQQNNQARLVKPPAPKWTEVIIESRTQVALSVVALELASTSQMPLLEPDAGAHIDVEIRAGLVRQYSLCNKPDVRGRYRIAVHLEESSRGGSAAVHKDLMPGHRVRISAPRNHFRLDRTARDHLLIAGGIGITPLFSMAQQLHCDGAPFRMVYRARSSRHAALARELAGSTFADRIRFAYDDQSDDANAFPELAAGCPSGLAVYCCGPGGLIEHVRALALAAGITPDRFHIERFGSAAIAEGEPFRLRAARSGVTVSVATGQTMLEALAEAGIEVPSSCLSGVCGTCLVDVLSGTPDHRDVVQSDAEKAADIRVALCCSRSRTDELTIDL